MRLSTRFNPVGGIQDFWSEFTRPNPYRWPILIASMLCTFGLLFWVTKERVIGPPARPEVTFISTFAEGRTDEEIVASNVANQQLQDQIREEQAVREEEVRDMYRTLGRASGLDVDAMKLVAEGVNALRSAGRSFLVITHYQRLLDHIAPDVVHIMAYGRIVKSGGPALALEVENNGYADILAEVA